ncbi:MAG TPA: OmpH family outer membrane protein [Thermodesulfobacteriaceae bacterium]|nr:OmpH family outer membrane protein [Thermodesulfobacteriaceae bacterium]
MKIHTSLSAILSVLVIIAAFFWSGSAFSAATTPGKLAVINMQKVVRNSATGQKAMDRINKKWEKLQAQLKAKQDKIRAFKEDVEKKAPLMSAEAKAEKERELKKMLRDYQEAQDDAQFEMRQAEAKSMEPILKELEEVVMEIGKKNGYSLILEKNMPGIYYFAPEADITQRIINAYDRKK